MVWGVRIGLIGLVSFGCATESPVAPSAQREIEFSLWGTVQDTAFRPIAGVIVEVLDRGMGVSALTDSTGRFQLPGVFSGNITVRASKADYIAVTKAYETRFAGAQALHFSLELSRPPANIAGDYTATFRADPSCTQLPEATRARTYIAMITPQATPPTTYDVVLSGARFWTSPRTDRFFGGVAGSSARFILDEGDGLAIVEELAPSQSLAIYGEADGHIDGSTIVGPFSGSFDYCSSLGSPAPGPLRCSATPVRCRSSNHQLTLIRR
jgi:hypothetical protein